MARILVHIYGIAFLLIGGMGFGFHGPRNATVDLFGLFPVNALHSLVHVLIGGLGVFSGVLGGPAPRIYGRVTGALFLALAVLGLIAPSGFGLMPLGGMDVALHLVAGATALWIGTAKGHEPLPSIDEGTVTR